MEYRVGLCYSGYADISVDAESEEEALEKARAEVASNPTHHSVEHLERWPEADTVEEE